MKLEFIRLTLAMTKINIAVAAMPECGKELLLEACDIMIPLCLRFPENIGMFTMLL